MLNREKESIVRMVSSRYQVIRDEQYKLAIAANEVLLNDYFASPATKMICAALGRELDLKDPEKALKNAVMGRGPGYGETVYLGENAPIRAGLIAKGWDPKVEQMPHFSNHPLHAVMDVALNTSTKKWKDISAGVYDFAADSSKVTSEAEFEKAIRKLLAALA